ncbi:unnamed protein product [Adineta steineri]|uniref:Uncharacterized protein n=1 Tax=Adineta steineri TaxID=433720 RepID=A0A818V5C8_9BILA|nr:unnamed protein product [Adineta steineri]
MIYLPFNEESSNEQPLMINSTLEENENNDNKKLWFLVQDNKNIIRNKIENKRKLNYHSFLESMSDIDQIYRNDNFLKKFQWLKFIIILIDSVFRGISQVMFANNPLSGIIIAIGLAIDNSQLILYGIFGTTISTLTAHILNLNYNSIRAGLYGYNGCLTAMAIVYFSLYEFPDIIFSIIIMSIFSTIFFESISKIFVNHLGIPSFTFSFQISSWILLLGAMKYQYVIVNGNILQPTLLTTVTNKTHLSNVSLSDYSFEHILISFFTSISQVYFVDNPYTGVIILIGIAICSKILALFALFGAISGSLTAAFLLKLPAQAIYHGLWGFNTVLTCQALGGMFIVLYGYKIWLLILYGTISTVFVQAAVSSFLSASGMPAFTFPFTFICWIFCLMVPSKDLIPVKLSDCRIPEDHYYRFCLSKFIKNEFKYLNILNILSSSSNEDITNNELLKIEKEFVPILMCTYAYRNDLNKMKILFKKINHNINLIDFNNRTPLHISASEGYMNICQWLIEKVKIDINVIDNFGSTPLFDGFINGHFNVTNYLFLNGGKFPLTKNKELAFYLNAFIYENNIEGVKYLLQLGFNPNETDYDGRYSLHLAVNTENLSIIRYLVEQTSISFDIKDHFNQTPYDYASKLSQSGIANYLNKEKYITIEKNKNIEIRIETNSFKQINNEKNISTITLEENLLPYLLSISTKDKLSNFIHEHPDINIFDCIDYDKRSLTHLAAINGQYEVFEYYQQNFNQEDRWNLSPLDYAIINKHSRIINSIKEKEDLSPIDNNKIEYKDNSIIYLLKKWKKIFLFLTLSASGDVERIESLFNRKYFIQQELYADYDGRTPMHLATAYGHMNVIQLLIRLGYNNGINNKDRWGYTPLDIAKQMKFINIIDQFQQQ